LLFQLISFKFLTETFIKDIILYFLLSYLGSN